jgi:hypothetical protein
MNQATTSELCNFVNSLIRSGKISEYKTLYQEAVSELNHRQPLIAKAYTL